MTFSSFAMATVSEQTLSTAERLLTELGHPGVRPVHLRDGREHHIFRVALPAGDRVLKFPRADAVSDPFAAHRTPAERLYSECTAIETVRNVPVPRPYDLFPTDPVCALLGFVPGTTAEIAYEKGQLDEDGLLAFCVQMGRMLAQIHRSRRPDGFTELPDLDGSDPATARLLHLDYHLGNVMAQRQLGGVWHITAVVDWTCARWGPPEADFVEMQVSVFISNPRARDAMIAGYRQVAARLVSVAEIERRAVLEIRRRFAKDPPDPTTAFHWRRWIDERR